MEDRSVGHAIKSLNNLMRRRFDRDRNRCMDSDVTVMHTWILIFIDKRGSKPTFQRDVEKAFKISKSTVTNIIKLMEKKGLVTRTTVDYDDRLKKICLTDKGKAVTAAMRQMAIESDKALIEGIEPYKVDIFFEVLNSITKKIEEELNHKS